MDIITICWYITIFLWGMVIGVIIGMMRMYFYMKKKIDEIEKARGLTVNITDSWIIKEDE